MIPPFDIFTVINGQPKWLGAAESLEEALLLATHKGEGLYLVFSQKTKNQQFYKITSDGGMKPSDGTVA